MSYTAVVPIEQINYDLKKVVATHYYDNMEYDTIEGAAGRIKYLTFYGYTGQKSYVKAEDKLVASWCKYEGLMIFGQPIQERNHE